MEDQESCKRALQIQQALGTTAKHEMGSWKPAEQQHLTSNTHTHHFYTVKRLKKKKSFFRDGQQWQTWWSLTSATGVRTAKEEAMYLTLLVMELLSCHLIDLLGGTCTVTCLSPSTSQLCSIHREVLTASKLCRSCCKGKHDVRVSSICSSAHNRRQQCKVQWWKQQIYKHSKSWNLFFLQADDISWLLCRKQINSVICIRVFWLVPS